MLGTWMAHDQSTKVRPRPPLTSLEQRPTRHREHLMRTHYRRACEQCETQIRSGAKSNGHTCKMRRTYRHGNSAALRAMFDDRVAQQLKSRSRQWKRGSTSEEQWAKIFLLIFPDTRTQVPSPCKSLNLLSLVMVLGSCPRDVGAQLTVPPADMETPQLPQSHETLLIKSFVDCLSVSLRDLEHGISDSELERIMSIIRRESQRYIDDRNPGASGSSDSCSSRATADLPANEPPYMEADCVDQRTLAEEPPELDADEGSLGSFSFPSTQEDCANSSWEVVQGSAELLTVVQPTEDCLARTDGVWGHYDDHPLDAFDYPDLWSTISTAGETI